MVRQIMVVFIPFLCFVSSKVGKKFKDTNKDLFNGRYD